MGEFTTPGDTKWSCDFISLSLDINVFHPDPEVLCGQPGCRWERLLLTLKFYLT